MAKGIEGLSPEPDACHREAYRVAIRDKDARRVQAVMEAMMAMVKLDVAALERAYNQA